MDIRNIDIPLKGAREWYYSGDPELRKLALQVYKEEELKCRFKNIIRFQDAVRALNLNWNDTVRQVRDLSKIDCTANAMFRLGIIRRALNREHDLHLTKTPEGSCIYYPNNPFITTNSAYYSSEITSGAMEVIGRIKYDGILYDVLGGGALTGGSDGLGAFSSAAGVGGNNIGFLGCATKEIAQHFSKHFGMLITEARYGGLPDIDFYAKIL